MASRIKADHGAEKFDKCWHIDEKYSSRPKNRFGQV